MCSKGARFFLYAVYYFFSAMGLIPFALNSNEETLSFHRSKFKFRYCLIIGIITAMLVFISFYSILLTVSFPELNLVRYLVYFEFFVRYATIATSFYQILSNEAKLRSCANHFLSVAQDLSGDRWQTKTVRKMYLIGMKVLCVDVSLCALFTINNASHAEKSFPKYRSINVYVVLVSAQVTNVVLIVLLLGAHGFRLVCDQLERSLVQLHCLETEGSNWGKRRAFRQQICCDASDSIDRLNALHDTITENVRSTFEVLQIPILCTNLNQFVVILSRIYFIYVSVVQQWYYGVKFDQFINSLTYVTFETLQCFFLMLGATVMAKQARKPGLVLNAYINAHLDVRTERSIEIFGLTLLTNERQVKIGGLYTMGLVFLYSLATTSASYLLVLVQFQLNMH